MEREDYQKRINDLLDGIQSLLDANNAMGEKIQKLEKTAAFEVFNGYFKRIVEGRRDYDLITEEVLC